jgi:hypothetical protein
MDIGEPPSNSYDDLPLNDPHHVGHTHLNLPAFSAAYPLPFRVLTLIGLEILLWAINLHVLTSLGIDAAGALDLTDEHPDALILDQVDRAEEGEEKILFDETDENHRSSVDGSNLQASRIIRLDSPSPTSTNIHLHPRAHSLPHLGSSTSSSNNSNSTFSRRRPLRRRTDLHQPIYTVFTLYTFWVGLGWLAFRYASGGSAEDMDGARWIIGVIVVGLGVGVTWRKTGFFARSERMGLLRFVRIACHFTLPYFAKRYVDANLPAFKLAQLVQAYPLTTMGPRSLFRRRYPRRCPHIVCQGPRRSRHFG